MVRAYVTPKVYESKTVVQILPPALDRNSLFGGEGNVPNDASARTRFIDNELEVIQSREVLERMTDLLDLRGRWNGMADEQIVETLEKSVQVERIGESDLVEIKVRHPNSIDALDLAEAVVHSYRNRRSQMELSRSELRLDAFDSELRDQEDRVEAARKVLHTIMAAIRIPYHEGEADHGGLREGEVEALAACERELSKLELEESRLEAEIGALKELGPDKLFGYLASKRSSPEMSDLWDRFRRADSLLGAKTSELGEDHLEVQQLKKERDLLQEEMAERIEAFRENLEVEAELNKRRLEAARAVRERRMDTMLDHALEMRDFSWAKRDFEAAVELLQKMERQLRLGRIALKMPKSPVVIHEKPIQAMAPVDIKIRQKVLVGVLEGVLLGFLGAILLSVFRSVWSRDKATEKGVSGSVPSEEVEY